MAYAEVMLTVGICLCGIGLVIEALRRRRRPTLAPGMPVPPELQDRVRLLLSEGRQVEAVREVRQVTGLGLVEAKRFVDGLRGDQVS